MNAVMIVLDRDPTWVSAKKELTDPKFVERIMKYDKENIKQTTLRKIEKYTKGDQF
jgi:dynein heavy chain